MINSRDILWGMYVIRKSYQFKMVGNTESPALFTPQRYTRSGEGKMSGWVRVSGVENMWNM